jgi:hypothetical protein
VLENVGAPGSRFFAVIAILSIAAAAPWQPHGGVRAQEAATGESPPITITLEVPARVSLGDRAYVLARVRLGAHAGRPLLLTPTSEGRAIEIVRGRLSRADADADPAAPRELRFRVPFVARGVGTSVLRARADGYECRDGRCRAIQIEASVAIEVLPAPAPE